MKKFLSFLLAAIMLLGCLPAMAENAEWEINEYTQLVSRLSAAEKSESVVVPAEVDGLAVRGIAYMAFNMYKNFKQLTIADSAVYLERNVLKDLVKLEVLSLSENLMIIREGNFTSFPGLYGYLFRHCNTLPLSSSLTCMKELFAALHSLFERGEKVLIYPEQGMWHDYKKPRPLKLGSFRLAVKEKVPVLPIFITLEDTEKTDAEGLPVQAYTVHILPPIFPDENLTVREDTERICRENYRLWKETYECFYGKKLEYTTEVEFDVCTT